MSGVFRKVACLSVFLILSLVAAQSSWAGSYSPGKGGEEEEGFVDAGIAGKVDGEINPVFVGWASSVVDYSPSDVTGTYGNNGIGSQFADPTKALGEVDNSIVSLGDMDATELANYYSNPDGDDQPGSITLGFDLSITNGEGADFAVFENGFISSYTTDEGSVTGLMFAELGYVEVSTDGENFVRFPSIYENDTPTGSTSYLTQDVSNIYNLVGKHNNNYGESWGTPFDLEDLSGEELVLLGLVDLNNINYIRIVDIPGDGSFLDSEGNSIYDAWVTWGSGGLDFDAVGVLNAAAAAAVPEPSSVLLFMASALGIVFVRRKTA